MALKKDEKDKLSKDELVQTQPAAPETETVLVSRPTNEKNAAADPSASPTEVYVTLQECIEKLQLTFLHILILGRNIARSTPIFPLS